MSCMGGGVPMNSTAEMKIGGLLKLIKAGDIIEFPNVHGDGISHWGICSSKTTMIHLDEDIDEENEEETPEEPPEGKFHDVVDLTSYTPDTKCRINNTEFDEYPDFDKKKPCKRGRIVKNAMNKVAEEYCYQDRWYGCEAFVAWARFYPQVNEPSKNVTDFLSSKDLRYDVLENVHLDYFDTVMRKAALNNNNNGQVANSVRQRRRKAADMGEKQKRTLTLKEQSRKERAPLSNVTESFAEHQAKSPEPSVKSENTVSSPTPTVKSTPASESSALSDEPEPPVFEVPPDFKPTLDYNPYMRNIEQSVAKKKQRQTSNFSLMNVETGSEKLAPVRAASVRADAQASLRPAPSIDSESEFSNDNLKDEASSISSPPHSRIGHYDAVSEDKSSESAYNVVDEEKELNISSNEQDVSAEIKEKDDDDRQQPVARQLSSSESENNLSTDEDEHTSSIHGTALDTNEQSNLIQPDLSDNKSETETEETPSVAETSGKEKNETQAKNHNVFNDNIILARRDNDGEKKSDISGENDGENYVNDEMRKRNAAIREKFEKLFSDRLGQNKKELEKPPSRTSVLAGAKVLETKLRKNSIPTSEKSSVGGNAAPSKPEQEADDGPTNTLPIFARIKQFEESHANKLFSKSSDSEEARNNQTENRTGDSIPAAPPSAPPPPPLTTGGFTPESQSVPHPPEPPAPPAPPPAPPLPGGVPTNPKSGDEDHYLNPVN